MTTTALPPRYRPDEIDAEWLDALLRNSRQIVSSRVTSVTQEPCGTGQLADSFRFNVTYDGPSEGPTTLVAKFASDDAACREFGRATGFYRSEIEFYRQLQPTIAVSTPVPLVADIEEDGGDFVLLMEDLQPARTVDQNIGCTVDDAAVVVEQAAKLHAATWGRSDLAAKPWLGAIVNTFVEVTKNFADTADAFRVAYADLMSEECFDHADRVSKVAGPWIEVLTNPVCLWHSDYRVDNILFDVRGEKNTVAILDWQTLGYGSGVIDLAEFIGLSLDIADRRRHEEELVSLYHQALCAEGVSGYSADECWRDYQANAIYGLQAGMLGAVQVKRTPRGDRMWQVWMDRATAQINDHDSFNRLS